MGASLSGLVFKLKQFVLGTVHDDVAVCCEQLCAVAYFCQSLICKNFIGNKTKTNVFSTNQRSQNVIEFPHNTTVMKLDLRVGLLSVGKNTMVKEAVVPSVCRDNMATDLW